MKFNSLSLAKTILLASLATGSISAWFAWTLTRDLPVLQQSLAQARKKATEATAARVALDPLADTPAVLQPLDAAFAAFMLELMNSRTRFGVEVSQAASAKPGNAERSPVEQLADELPGTRVRSLKFEVQGTYSDYERFMGFLAHARQIGAASLVHLRVKDSTYSLSVRIYGKG